MRKWVILVLVINLALFALWFSRDKAKPVVSEPAPVGNLQVLPTTGAATPPPAKQTPVSGTGDAVSASPVVVEPNATTPATVKTAEPPAAEVAKTATTAEPKLPTPPTAVTPVEVAPTAPALPTNSVKSTVEPKAEIKSTLESKLETKPVIEPKTEIKAKIPAPLVADSIKKPSLSPDKIPTKAVVNAKTPVIAPPDMGDNDKDQTSKMPVNKNETKNSKATARLNVDKKPVTPKVSEPKVVAKTPTSPVRTLATTVLADKKPAASANFCRILGPNSGPNSLNVLAKILSAKSAKVELLKQEQQSLKGYKVMLAPEEGFQAAMALIEKLARSGIKSYLPPEEINSFRLQAGYFQQEKNALEVIGRLKNLGFDATLEQNRRNHTDYSLKVQRQGDEKQLADELNKLLLNKKMAWIQINPCQ